MINTIAKPTGQMHHCEHLLQPVDDIAPHADLAGRGCLRDVLPRSPRAELAVLHLNFPVCPKEFPIRFRREFRANHLEDGLFSAGKWSMIPLDLQNSRYFP